MAQKFDDNKSGWEVHPEITIEKIVLDVKWYLFRQPDPRFIFIVFWKISSGLFHTDRRSFQHAIAVSVESFWQPGIIYCPSPYIPLNKRLYHRRGDGHFNSSRIDDV